MKNGIIEFFESRLLNWWEQGWIKDYSRKEGYFEVLTKKGEKYPRKEIKNIVKRYSNYGLKIEKSTSNKIIVSF